MENIRKNQSSKGRKTPKYLEKDVDINRNYKDGIFKRLMSDKRNAVELFNAIAGTDYNVNDVAFELTTVNGIIFNTIKNDISFKINERYIVMCEHQSTVCLNMPARIFLYLADQFKALTDGGRDLLKKKRVELLTPVLVVFYNGDEDQPAERVFRLSDAYQHDKD